MSHAHHAHHAHQSSSGRGNTVMSFEERLSRIENTLERVLRSVESQERRFNTFEQTVTENLEKCSAVLCLLVMREKSSADGKGTEDTAQIMVEAESQSVPAYLTGELLSKAGAYVITKFVIEYMDKEDYGILNVTKPARLLMFAPHASVRKNASKTPIGVAFLKMKFLMIRSYIRNCVQLANKKERQQNGAPPETHVTTSDGNAVDSTQGGANAAYFRPRWAKPNVLTKRLVQAECERLSGIKFGKHSGSASEPVEEVTGGTAVGRPRKKRKVTDGPDAPLAKAVVGKMWGSATYWLCQGRYQAKMSATRSLGFVAIPSAQARWQFRCPVAYFAAYRGIEDAVMPVNGQTVDQCDANNKGKFHSMVASLRDLEFTASYKVCVTTSNDDDTVEQDEETIRELTITVNLLEEALKYLTSFFQLKKPFQFIRLCPDTFRLVFMVAMSMAEFLDTFYKKQKRGASFAELEKYMVTAGYLVEGELTRNNIIQTYVLNLTDAQYEQMNRPRTAPEGGDAAGRKQPAQGESDDSDEDNFDAVVFDY